MLIDMCHYYIFNNKNNFDDEQMEWTSLGDFFNVVKEFNFDDQPIT
jgi:hypothetical protein